MRRCAILFAVVSLLLPITVFSQTQTPEAALNHFKNALRKLGNGDLDGAIEDYTRAISSELALRYAQELRQSHWETHSLTTPAKASRVIDPFTANAYNNRGLARFKKGDYMGAIEDFDQALQHQTRPRRVHI